MSEEPGKEKTPIIFDLTEIPPEHLLIYKGVQDGTIGAKELSRLLDADGLVDDLLNIKGFERRLAAYLEQGVSGTLLAIDLDYFKLFNDSQGHPAGDDLLKLVGKILHEQTRTSVVGSSIQEKRRSGREEFDLLARAGDEFLVFLVDADIPSTINAATRIRTAMVIEAQQAFPNYNQSQTLSLGLSKIQPGDTVKILRQRADGALYEAKKDRGSPDVKDGIAIY